MTDREDEVLAGLMREIIVLNDKLKRLTRMALRIIIRKKGETDGR